MNVISLVFLNGKLVAEQSNLAALPTEVAFNSGDELILHFPRGFVIEKPLHLLFLTNQNIELQQNIIIEENASVNILEEHMVLQKTGEDYTVCLSANMILEKSARCHYYKKLNKSLHGKFTNTLNVIQKAQSHFAMWTSDVGTADFKQQLNVKLQESHATCQLHGLYALSDDKSSHSQDIEVEHIAPHGTSAMFFKGILDNQSYANFKGKVHVHKDAVRTNALQANHTLLLSKKAEIRTQPELEINAEDIQCSHGATVSEVDEASLFYLCSRGMEKASALRLLISAFTAEVVHKIPHHEIKQYFMKELDLHE